MPRMRNETVALLDDLKARISAVVETARNEGRNAALAEIRALVGGGAFAPRRGPGRPRKNPLAPAATPKKKRKNSWAGLSAEARLARINAIRKGKGLPPREK